MKSMMLGTVLLVGFIFPVYGDASKVDEQRKGLRILERLTYPYTKALGGANRVGCIRHPNRTILKDLIKRPPSRRYDAISTIFSMDDEQLDAISGLTDEQYKAISSLGGKKVWYITRSYE